MLFFEFRDHENRIREVQLVYREVVPRLFDPPDRWDKANNWRAIIIIIIPALRVLTGGAVHRYIAGLGSGLTEEEDEA